MMDKLHNYRIELVRVIDANTIIANIDLGFGVYKSKASIQLAWVEESTEGYTFEDYKQKLIDEIEGKELMIHSRKLDGFGRALSTLYVLDGDSMYSVNSRMNDL